MLLQERGINALQAWGASQLPQGLLEEILSHGLHVSHDPDETLKAGLTGVLAGIAETGTLVVTAAEGQPLTASLLPEIHIAVMQAGNIHASLPDALNLREVQEASSIALISGPSRTADIEMTLTIGVHGPRELHVLCVE